MTETVFIRAEVIGELPSGKKGVHLLANNADGICFYTDDKSIVADVVEVVRCKDCKYFEISEGDALGLCKCGYITVSYGGELYPQEDDFCSYGERKDDAE